jgi:hypothetical protein
MMECGRFSEIADRINTIAFLYQFSADLPGSLCPVFLQQDVRLAGHESLPRQHITPPLLFRSVHTHTESGERRGVDHRSRVVLRSRNVSKQRRKYLVRGPLRAISRHSSSSSHKEMVTDGSWNPSAALATDRLQRPGYRNRHDRIEAGRYPGGAQHLQGYLSIQQTGGREHVASPRCCMFTSFSAAGRMQIQGRVGRRNCC